MWSCDDVVRRPRTPVAPQSFGNPLRIAPRETSGTEGSNPSSSSSQSVLAVNPEAIGEKPGTLGAVCVSLGT
jgi:hypothetical protein